MSRNVCRVIGCVVVGWMALVSSSIAQAATVMSMPDTAQGATGVIVQVPMSWTNQLPTRPIAAARTISAPPARGSSRYITSWTMPGTLARFQSGINV